jgi:serine/threonine protein kinase
MLREIEVLKKMPPHPNIVRLIKAIELNKKLYLVLEFCQEGDLEKFLKKKGGRLSESDARYVLRHILRGLCFMNEKCNVMH